MRAYIDLSQQELAARGVRAARVDALVSGCQMAAGGGIRRTVSGILRVAVQAVAENELLAWWVEQ
jgi:hypothetical protein